jgi:hypothetical protein
LEEDLKKRNGKNLGIKNYEVKFLPVNELENFAVLSDVHFSDALIETHKITLEDHFSQTAGANIDHNNNKFATDLFKYTEKYRIANQMKREAEKDIKRYFPGKEIKKLKANLDANKALKNLEAKDYPQELKDYLATIKSFFQKPAIK